MSKSYDRRNNRRDTGTPYSRNAPRSEMRGRKPPSSTPRMNKTQQSRHDKETSKKLVWDRQADTKTLSKNQEVRQRYKETSGDGMDAADVERAKLLIARDQRKQEKMKKKKKQKEEPTETNGEVPIKSNGTTEKEIDTSTPKKAQEEAHGHGRRRRGAGMGGVLRLSGRPATHSLARSLAGSLATDVPAYQLAWPGSNIADTHCTQTHASTLL